MQISTLISHSAEVLRIILKSHKPSDNLLRDYLSGKKYIGSKDRKSISELTFLSLRLLPFIECVINKLYDNSDTVNKYDKNHLTLLVSISALVASESHKRFTEELFNYLSIDPQFNRLNPKKSFIDSAISINGVKSNYLIENINYSFESLESELGCSILLLLPEYMKSQLSNSGKGDIFLNELAQELALPAQLVIRINKNYDRHQVIQSLMEKNIDGYETEISPIGIRINKRVRLNELEIYKSGIIEVQDEGSQLIGYAIDAEKGDNVLDACAGAGGKSLQMSFLYDGIKILATDVELARLKETTSRANKAGITNIRTLLIKPGNEMKQINQLFDKILIDAPCSGSGTMKRNPMARMKISKLQIEKHQRKQIRIVDKYSQFLKPGGYLIYSTCSILPDENEFIADYIMRNYSDYEPSSLYPIFKKYGIFVKGLQEGIHHLTLYPHIHNCDGFFIARFRRKEYGE